MIENHVIICQCLHVVRTHTAFPSLFTLVHSACWTILLCIFAGVGKMTWECIWIVSHFSRLMESSQVLFWDEFCQSSRYSKSISLHTRACMRRIGRKEDVNYRWGMTTFAEMRRINKKMSYAFDWFCAHVLRFAQWIAVHFIFVSKFIADASTLTLALSSI